MPSFGPGGAPRRSGGTVQAIVVIAVLAAVAIGGYFIFFRGGKPDPAGPGKGPADTAQNPGPTGGPAQGGPAVDPPAPNPADGEFPGKEEYRKADYAGAAAKLAEYVRKSPKDALAQYMLGRSYIELGKTGEADACLERALEGDPAGTVGGAAALCLGDLLYDRHYAKTEDQDRTKWERIRTLYSTALRTAGFGPERKQLVDRLDALNAHLIWSKMMTADSVMHTVVPGEAVEKIAGQYGLPKDCSASVSRINKLKDDRISVGQQLKVIKPLKMEIFVNKKHLRLTAYLNGYYFGEYPVAIGKGGSTPAGDFVISVDGKDRNPDWTQTLPDGTKKIHKFGEPGNILGTRWMRIDDRPELGATSLGIHGTTDPKSVPGRESAGCIRMLNENVEILFDFTPGGTKVTIVN